MVSYRIVERPSFAVIGKKTWIGGPDNEAFGRFWVQCRQEGLFDVFGRITQLRPGAQTQGVTLGISRVEQDPARREFDYMIAVENPDGIQVDGLELYTVPGGRWAVFECRGAVPDSIVRAEMYAFMEWLPASGYVHALAPEMEVYPPLDLPNNEDTYCEFWLPIDSRE